MLAPSKYNNIKMINWLTLYRCISGTYGITKNGAELKHCSSSWYFGYIFSYPIFWHNLLLHDFTHSLKFTLDLLDGISFKRIGIKRKLLLHFFYMYTKI